MTGTPTPRSDHAAEEALRIALPSKGRLLDPTLDFLASCGFAVKGARNTRDYSASIPSLPNAAVELTAASEIPQRLASGEAHLGVTGLDLIAETFGSGSQNGEMRPGAPVSVRTLGFGKADLVVAVPRAWIDVDTMADIAEVAQAYRRRHGRRMRVATKYLTLTRGFFADHNVLDYRIVKSDGATEAAPATGNADIIVDITSTGSTLAANHLKTLRDGTILSSQATLFVSGAPSIPWTPPVLAGLRQLLDMVDAKTAAASRKMVFARLPFAMTAPDGPARLQAVEEGLVGLADSPLACAEILGRRSGDAISVRLIAPADNIYGVVGVLRAHGARDVIVQDTDYVFDGTHPSSFDQVAARLGMAGAPVSPSGLS